MIDTTTCGYCGGEAFIVTIEETADEARAELCDDCCRWIWHD